MARAAGAGRLQWAGGSTEGKAQRAPGGAGHGGGGAAVIPGDLLRPEYEALSREAERGARHPVELHLGAAGATRSGAGGAGTEAREAPSPAGAAADGGHAAAHGTCVSHRWEQASVVRRRPLARSDRDSGGCDQRDLLRATGGGRIDPNGDGGLAKK